MKISASVLSCDFTNISQEIDKIKNLNVDFIHLDIMDGCFVPNISFGPHISSCIKKISKTPIETHLMISNPENFIEKFNFSHTIIFHFESCAEKNYFLQPHRSENQYYENKYVSCNIKNIINMIKNLNIKAGISVKPKTDIEKILSYLENIDLVLVMTVEPGFGGQKFMENQVQKIKFLKNFRKQNNLNFDIEVDGGINNITARICEDNGADIAVAGTYIFNSKNVENSINLLRGSNG